MLTYEQARNKVIEQVAKKRGPREVVCVSVWDALGLVLAQEVKTDRQYPPFDRSTRDGFAVRAKEVAAGAKLKCVGEIMSIRTAKTIGSNSNARPALVRTSCPGEARLRLDRQS